MTSLCFQTLNELKRQLDSRAISCVDLLDTYRTQIEKHNPALNAVVTLDVERARERARWLDERMQAGERVGPLHGLPMTVKDTLETRGIKTTAGSPKLRDYVPERNALVVQRLEDAGAVIFGKTNTPPFAADLQTHNDVFGRTNNPWDLSRTPGGSSGGSAAAVAAGLTAVEIGSDIGGSLRTPAHFCGVYTIKPTYGIVPSRGLIASLNRDAAPRDLGCIGPLARSAEDLRLVLAVVAGADPVAAEAWQLELPEPRFAHLRDYRVAAWLDDSAYPIDSEVKEVLEAAVNDLEEQGVTVDRQARPDFSLAEAVDVYLRLLAAASVANLPDKAYAKRVAGIDDYPRGTREREAFKSVRYSLQSSRELLMAMEARHQLQRKWQRFFSDYDILLCPVNPVVAFPHIDTDANFFQDITVNAKAREYSDMLAWVGGLAGVAHLPAVSAPVGLSRGGLPVGVQIVAPQYHDYTAIDFAARLAAVRGGFVQPPALGR